MSEADNKAQGQKARMSKLALLSLLVPSLFFVGYFIWEIEKLFDPYLDSYDITMFLAKCSTLWTVGYIFGGIALKKIKKSDGSLRGRNVAIAGLVISLVQMVLFGFSVLVVMSHRYRPPDYWHRLSCAGNLRSLHNVILIYANDDTDGKYPTPDRWCELVKINMGPYLRYFMCNGALAGNDEGRCHYAINPQARPNSPNDVVLLFETTGGWNQFGGREILTFDNHKGKGCNVLFNDGHVEFLRPGEVAKLNWGDGQKR